MAWTDEYREIVEFYYWEPQHIGRSGGVKLFDNADAMWDHVGRIEVSLNHVLNVFFSLYQMEKLACFETHEPMTMMSSSDLEVINRQQKNATQPDMFFTGTTHNIAVELKIGSPCTLEQVIKYIRFNQAISDKPLTLFMLTPTRDIHRIFKEKFESLDTLKRDLVVAGINGHPRIRFITYRDLLESLNKLKPKNPTEKKLVEGLIGCLAGRPELKLAD